ncbi:MAG: DUF4450 domain-containing protein [Prevotella sp.]|nr:DUF4450 domain-containing protein [Prevotella sp.]
MSINKVLSFAVAVLVSTATAVFAQDDRSLQYHPEGEAFVCVNGNNQYTRALYGSHTDWRLETSDRPIFASFKKKGQSKNIRIYIQGKDIYDYPLDSAEYCKAEYKNGMRHYTIRDRKWGDGEIRLHVGTFLDRDSALFHFEFNGIDRNSLISFSISNVKNNKFSRNGDLNADKGDFSPTNDDVKIYSFGLDDKDLIFEAGGQTIDNHCDPLLYQQMQAERQEISNQLQICCPDKWLLPVINALPHAAEGIWDNKTQSWMHGAVGWRMPLPGWRAAFIGDMLGQHDRARRHFTGYCNSQVTNVTPVIPHPTQDSTKNLARAEKRWGTQMYSNGYICRYPNRNDVMHHYDMNHNFIDELLTHLSFSTDSTFARRAYDVLRRHIEWEKRCFDPDDDGLYDAYCCIWASDALYYNGGAVTHSSAYMYRALKGAEKLAVILGEDPEFFSHEAKKTLDAMNRRLWLPDGKHWAEYQDLMGLKRIHPNPALWSIYTPIDCNACSPLQAWQATARFNSGYPRRSVRCDISHHTTHFVIPTSMWQPYDWSTNNVAAAETMHTALACYKAGRNDLGYSLMMGNILDQMYLGASPGNFGQLSYYDRIRGEMYRDFGDCIGISSKTIIEGLFGIRPDALEGKCVIQPAFPSTWDSCSISTPYLSYKYHKEDKRHIFDITQNFSKPLSITVRLQKGWQSMEIVGTREKTQQIVITDTLGLCIDDTSSDTISYYENRYWGNGFDDIKPQKMSMVDISKSYNANVDDIFKNSYLSPRPNVTTLQIPCQGIGDWCSTDRTAVIADSLLRTHTYNGILQTSLGIPFRLPTVGHDIAYTSLWDNYPDSITINIGKHGTHAYLLLAGSTNQMQSHIDNGMITITYTDGSTERMPLHNPYNWPPIEQDFLIDGFAFRSATPPPYRLELSTGVARRTPNNPQDPSERYINGGAATLLDVRLNPKKKVQSITIRTLSNDILIGVIAITIQTKG